MSSSDTVIRLIESEISRIKGLLSSSSDLIANERYKIMLAAYEELLRRTQQI